jgi:glycosyltransferase involved in cell wall biosynthesis
MSITVIVPVLNEGHCIHLLLDSFVAQTRPLDELIIVDGGSSDNTVAILQQYQDQLPLKILHRPHGNISISRNLAIRMAQYDIIAATDAGQSVHPGWLEAISRPLLDDPELQVVGGIGVAEGRTLFEIAMGALATRLPKEIKPHLYLPGSHSVAFRKSAWQAVGGYPEWLDYCEDLVFVMRIKLWCDRFIFEPRASVHFIPRSTIPAFAVQYFHYARGDGKAGLWYKRHLMRYATYMALLTLIFVPDLTIPPVRWGLIALGGLVRLYRAYRRLFATCRRKNISSPVAVLYLTALIPVLRVIGDGAKLIGYPVGLLWRWRHQPPDWRTVVVKQH